MTSYIKTYLDKTSGTNNPIAFAIAELADAVVEAAQIMKPPSEIRHFTEVGAALDDGYERGQMVAATIWKEQIGKILQTAHTPTEVVADLRALVGK